MTLDNAHWMRRGHKQRMTCSQWREILLAEQDKIIVRGRVRTLVAKNLGAGVVEVGIAETAKEEGDELTV